MLVYTLPILMSLLMQGFRFQVDMHYDSNAMYQGYYTCDCSESSFPERERLYYNQTLSQQFPDSEEEVAQEVERRHLLKQVRYLYYDKCPIIMSSTIYSTCWASFIWEMHTERVFTGTERLRLERVDRLSASAFKITKHK